MRARLLVALVLGLFCVPTYAQFNAAIQGTVKDQAGAVIPNAKVTVTSQETSVSRETTTSDEGFYRISGLPPGKYTVTVDVQGFKKSVTKDVVVAAEQVRGFDVGLELGAITESVTVTATAPALQSENANVAAALTTTDIERLPATGRDPYELLRLAPGVFGDLARGGNGKSIGLPNGPPNSGGPGGSNSSIFQTENQVPISANGQRVSANNFTIDGVSVNSLTWGGAAVVTPSEESVKEITVISSSYSAEDGRNSGAQIKVISQNGTNAFHGSGFYKHDDAGLNAFNKFASSPKRVENKLRQFGGSIGGPILKDKLFFFFAYEGERINNSQILDRFVETKEFRQQVASLRSGTATATILSQPGVEPRIVRLLTQSCANFGGRPCAVVSQTAGIDIGSITGSYGQYVSLGNPGGGGLDGIPDLLFAQIAAPQQSRGHQYNGRVDYTQGRQQFAGSVYVTRRTDQNADAAAQGRPMADLNSRPTIPSVMVSWISTLSSTMLNEMRYNFTRFAFDEVSTNPNANFGIPRVEVEGLPLNPGGERIRFGIPWGETTPGVFAENTFTFRDVFSLVRGAQTWKFGFEHTWEQDNNNLLGGSRPLYSFVGLFNLANGTPIFEQINTDPRTGRPTDAQRYFRTRYLGAFIQNDWKVRPNFTLNLGLRYEYFSPLRETKGHLTNLALGQGVDALAAASVVVNDRLFSPDTNNFAPRIGFAWSPLRFHSKLVFRGGVGMAYDRIHEAMFANTRGNPPFLARWGLCCGTASTDFGTPFAGGTIAYVVGTSSSITSYPVNPALTIGLNPSTNLPLSGQVEIWGTPDPMRNPYVYTYSLDVEYSLPWQMVGTLGFQGSSSHRLVRIVNQNLIFDRLNSAISRAFFPTPDVNGNFNALNTRVQRRFSKGFEFLLSYRWSKSIDQLSNEGPGFVTNQTFPRDLSTERGPSDYDATHYVVFSGLWDLPIFRTRTDWVGKVLGGWEINGIFAFHSGFPWTPVSFSNCIPLISGQTICPVRPTKYLGGAKDGSSNDTFLSPHGNFPGIITNQPCPTLGQPYFDICTVGRPGVGRNAFRGPRYTSVDLSLVKSFGLPAMPFFGESSKVEFRANFFNAFNKLNLAPFGFSSGSTVVHDINFGRATDGLAGRVIEFQARFSF